MASEPASERPTQERKKPVRDAHPSPASIAEALLGPVPLRGGRGSAARKALGAYYTDAAVADFLVRWALRDGREIVLDPSCGDGVFLKSAAGRLRELGGDPSRQVYGVEVDGAAHRSLALLEAGAPAPGPVLHADFFDLDPGALPAADAVVGNPPFIRYQRFSGEARQKALHRALEAGVRLSRLSSAWAPFLVHACRFVRPGGRLAMVAPAELTHATYARPLLDHLRRSFRDVAVLSFARRLFPSLSEDTVLLLADGRGEAPESFRLVDLPGVEALGGPLNPVAELPAGVPMDPAGLGEGRERALHYLLPGRLRDLYREVRRSAVVYALGDVAGAGIGYVTGDNNYFHLDKNTVEAYGLPSRLLRPAVRTGADLVGLRFTPGDWQSLHRRGHANLLLHVPAGEPMGGPLQAYLLQGERRGVPNRYKCRVREPWYRVPHVYEGDGFLTYMSGAEPRLVANEAGVVAPNTLHVVRLHPDCPFDAPQLAAAWQTSLTALSCEMEGHSLGGGMLKLEPTEARRVVLALPHPEPGAAAGLPAEMDGLLRTGRAEAARDLADDTLLRHRLGLSEADMRQLREGWTLLRNRRLHR